MRPPLASLAILILAAPVCAQTANVQPPEPKTHFSGRFISHSIGETSAELLSKEPELQQQVSSCERDPGKTDCDWVLATVKNGRRGTLSNSNWTSFVLDDGKLVKLQALVHGEFARIDADLTAEFGPRSSDTSFPMRNAIGQNWEDRLYVWNTPTLYVGLREDNNPASQNHHWVLVIESRAEHLQHAGDSKLSSARNQN